MIDLALAISLESENDATAIERLHERTFGPGRYAKTAYRLREAIAGACFGLTLAMVEPSWAIFLGGDPALWSGTNVLLAGAATVLACALVAPVSAQGTAR